MPTPITIQDWNPTSLNTQAQKDTAQQNIDASAAKPVDSLNFSLSTAKSMFLYRVGIGELQFNPKNIQLAESIVSKVNVEDDIYGKTNPFVSYVNTTRTFSIAFIMPADTAGFRIVADQGSAIKTRSVPNGQGVIPYMNVIKSFLYANYSTLKETTNNRVLSRTIRSPPIFKLLNKSIISNGRFPAATEVGEESMAKEFGLLGFIKDFKLDPLFAVGYVPFSPTSQLVMASADAKPTDPSIQQFDAGGNYKEVKVSFTFIPIFDQPLGWDTENDDFFGVDNLGGINGANIIKNILNKRTGE